MKHPGRKRKNKSKQSILVGRPPEDQVYRTKKGMMLHGKTEELLEKKYMKRFYGKVDLIFTSPPYPLNHKKKYGNLNGQEYIEWLCSYGPLLKKLLKKSGSIVLELGNSWEKGLPTMSTLALKALLEFQERNKFYLCQEFIWNNSAKLPSPVQWVNIERIRVKDSFTRLWWLSPSPRPKADNRRVLLEYSESMKKLLKNGTYNSGKRASQHNIGEKSFLTNNGGAISGSVLTFPNTSSNDYYLKYCKAKNLTIHPARMPIRLAEFFIKFLTKKNDLVFDPFGGSNITGYTSEYLDRQWISIEANKEYIDGSKARFI